VKPEDIARKYRDIHPGYRLVGYAECGLPFTETVLSAFTIEYKKLSPIFEFTLKSIRAGIEDRGTLAQFLGLDPNFLKDVLSELLSSGDISLQERLRLTEKGKTVLERAESEIPIEQSITIDFDRTLERPINLFGERTLAPRDLKDDGLLEIPAIPARRIEFEDVKIEEIQSILDRIAQTARVPRRVVLSVKDVGRQSSKFRAAVALRYQNPNGEERISFAIDGILNKELEDAFGRKKGTAKLNLETFKQNHSDNQIEEERAKFKEQISDDLTVARLTEEEAVAKVAVAEAEEKVSTSKTEAAQVSALAELDTAQKEHSKIDGELKKVTSIRNLAVFDHADILVDALKNSKQRLMIISPWIRRKVVNEQFLKEIENLLTSGVSVYIGYGYSDGSRGDPSPIRKLGELMKRFRNFYFVDFGDTHAKVLISDDRYFVVSSFNWLSFKGDPTATFRDEQGILVALPNLVNEKFQDQLVRFNLP